MDGGAQWAIEVAGLEKRYGDRRAVDGIDLRIPAGEVFGLLGPNGAGKTSTVETLEGYRKPDGGTVRVLGLDPQTDGPSLRGRIGVMLQEGGLYPGVRPLEALKLFAAFYPNPDDPERLLDLVGLREVAGTYVRRLSGGECQRLSLALALVGRPEVVFLDEPTAGMDPRARATTWQLVRELRDARGRPSCSRRTTWTRPSTCATGSRSSTTVVSSSRAHRVTSRTSERTICTSRPAPVSTCRPWPRR